MSGRVCHGPAWRSSVTRRAPLVSAARMKSVESAASYPKSETFTESVATTVVAKRIEMNIYPAFPTG